MTLGPRLQVQFSTAEMVAIGELARQENRTPRAQIRQCMLEELRRRGLLLTPGAREEEPCSPPVTYRATSPG